MHPMQNWSKIKKPENYSLLKLCSNGLRGDMPTASHITGGTVFVMIGGCGSGGSTLNEVWLCDTNQWNKVLSPFTLTRTFQYKAQNECPNISHEL